MTCHGCDDYRPARITLFHELYDDDLEHATIDELRSAYRALRAHHVEETTALWALYTVQSDVEKRALKE